MNPISPQLSTIRACVRVLMCGNGAFVLILGWLVGFYGISYLTPNPFLYEYSVPFQTIQFNMSTQFQAI